MNQNNKEWFGRMKKALIYTGLVLVLMGIAVHSGFSQGGGLVKPEMVFPKHYPYGFHGMGEIGRIAEDDIVIDDTHFALSPDVTYHTLEIENASKSFFRPGMTVGYLLAHEKVIKSLWMIKE